MLYSRCMFLRSTEQNVCGSNFKHLLKYSGEVSTILFWVAAISKQCQLLHCFFKACTLCCVRLKLIHTFKCWHLLIISDKYTAMFHLDAIVESKTKRTKREVETYQKSKWTWKIGTKSFGTGGINQGWSFTPKTGLSWKSEI